MFRTTETRRKRGESLKAEGSSLKQKPTIASLVSHRYVFLPETDREKRCLLFEEMFT